MSDRMTSIWLASCLAPGIAEYGRMSRDDMVRLYREYAQRQKHDAEKILAAADEDFRVQTYVGVFVQRNREIIQATPKETPHG